MGLFRVARERQPVLLVWQIETGSVRLFQACSQCFTWLFTCHLKATAVICAKVFLSVLVETNVSQYLYSNRWSIYSRLPSVCVLYLNVLVSSYAVLFSVLWFNSFLVQNICIDVFITCFVAVYVDQVSVTDFCSLIFLVVMYAFLSLHRYLLCCVRVCFDTAIWLIILSVGYGLHLDEMK